MCEYCDRLREVGFEFVDAADSAGTPDGEELTRLRRERETLHSALTEELERSARLTKGIRAAMVNLIGLLAEHADGEIRPVQ